MTNGLTDGWTDWGVGARDACASKKLFIVCHHVGHHVHLHVSHHGGHRNVVSMLCEVSKTMTEWKPKVLPTYGQSWKMSRI